MNLISVVYQNSPSSVNVNPIRFLSSFEINFHSGDLNNIRKNKKYSIMYLMIFMYLFSSYFK